MALALVVLGSVDIGETEIKLDSKTAMSVELSEHQWQKILSILQAHPQVRIRQQQQCRRFICAVLWMTRSGSQWRLLPQEYGNWNSVYKRFNRWSELGIWQQLFEQVMDEPDRENLLPDSTIVRAHPCANGGKGGVLNKLWVAAEGDTRPKSIC